jgi:hypothetical protein
MRDYRRYRRGDRDDKGNILMEVSWPVQLWRTPKGNYIVNLWVTNDDALYNRTNDDNYAYELFNNVCDMLPN